MSKRTNKNINATASKKPRISSSESCEKENLSIEEDSGLGPEIDDEGNNDKMAISLHSQNSYLEDNTNSNSKALDFKAATQRRTRSLSLQDTNTMKKLATDQPNAVSNKSPRNYSLRSRNIQLSTLNVSLLSEDAVDEPLAKTPPYNEHSLMEVNGDNVGFSPFSSTQLSTDNFNVNKIISETLKTPQKNATDSERKSVTNLSQHLEDGDEVMLNDSSVSLSQVTAQTMQEEEAEITSLLQNSANDYNDIFNEIDDTNVENAELPPERPPSPSYISDSGDSSYSPSASPHVEAALTRLIVLSETEKSQPYQHSTTPSAKKKRRRAGMRFTHIKTHKTPVESKLILDNYKPGLSIDRERIIKDIYMPKDFPSRLYKNISKIGLTKKIIINYYGRDRMPKIALKEPVRKHPGEIHPTLLVNDRQVHDIIDLYKHYAPLLSLKGPPLPFTKVRQMIGNLCSQIRNFY